MEKNFSDLVKESISDEEKRIANNSKINSKTDFNTLRRKIRQNFFVGFGAGLIIAAGAFYLFRPQENPNIISQENQVSEMTKEEIIKEAKILGMEFPMDKLN